MDTPITPAPHVYYVPSNGLPTPYSDVALVESYVKRKQVTLAPIPEAYVIDAMAAR